MEVLTVILASLFSAAVLFVIAKIIGHKQVAQLEFFDYITGITIGSIAAELAATLDKPEWKPTVSMIVFGFITETWLKKELKEQGYKNAQKEVAHLFDLHLDYTTKKQPPTKPHEKALQKFKDFLEVEKDG